MRERFVPWSVGILVSVGELVSRQYGKLEMWVRIPDKAQIIFLSKLSSICLSDTQIFNINERE